MSQKKSNYKPRQYENQNMEYEIQNILNNIKKREIRTLDEIREQNRLAIDMAYEPFMEFEANIKNYNQIKDTDKLDMYEFVDYEFLQFGDYIRFFDKKFFFNMKLHPGGVVKATRDDKLLIYTFKNGFEWIQYDNYIFRKLNEEDMAKIKLIELIGEKL